MQPLASYIKIEITESKITCRPISQSNKGPPETQQKKEKILNTSVTTKTAISREGTAHKNCLQLQPSLEEDTGSRVSPAAWPSWEGGRGAVFRPHSCPGSLGAQSWHNCNSNRLVFGFVSQEAHNWLFFRGPHFDGWKYRGWRNGRWWVKEGRKDPRQGLRP